jgi:BlaI family transcriptional regulator, penicillinase repressor
VTKPDPIPLSERQLEIMNVVWERGETTVADVWEALTRRSKIARNTVLTLMQRLEEKGWLRHRAEGNVFLFSATRAKEGVLGKMVSRLVDTAFQGSAEGLVMTLLDARGVSSQELARIREMIERAGRKK